MRILYIFLLLIGALNLFAQNDWQKKNKIAFSYTYGNQLLLDVSYRYQISLFNLNYYRKLVVKKKWGVDLMLNPHFGVTEFYLDNDDPIARIGNELGLNIGGIIHHKFIWEELRMYCQLSLGPHYLSNAPLRQNTGFIFSDNASIGLIAKVESSAFIFIGAGIRHLSNANLSSPNRGINNTIFQLGCIFNVN